MSERRDGPILGLFEQPADAADAVEALHGAGFRRQDVTVMTGSPYPEGAFGEAPEHHRLPIFAVGGGVCGFVVGLLLTIGTQLSYPLVTGGKPLLSIPPMINVLFEGTMLGAIIFTVLGVLFESRLPDFRLLPYDGRISEGYVGVVVSPPPGRQEEAAGLLTDAGARDIVVQEREHALV